MRFGVVNALIAGHAENHRPRRMDREVRRNERHRIVALPLVAGRHNGIGVRADVLVGTRTGTRHGVRNRRIVQHALDRRRKGRIGFVVDLFGIRCPHRYRRRIHLERDARGRAAVGVIRDTDLHLNLAGVLD